MLDWHATAEALGPRAAGPFRFSREGTAKRREARAATAAGGAAVSGLLALAGYVELGPAGAALGLAAALGVAMLLQRVERSYLSRIVPAIEVHERGVCFCDSGRPVLFEELSGLIVGSNAVMLAFKKGLDVTRGADGERRPWWERGIRRAGYWEVRLDGFADGPALRKALVNASGLPTQHVTDEVLDALESSNVQGIARVPAAPVEFRF